MALCCSELSIWRRAAGHHHIYRPSANENVLGKSGKSQCDGDRDESRPSSLLSNSLLVFREGLTGAEGNTMTICRC